MNRQAFMTIAAAESVVTGLAALLGPTQLAAFFGVTIDDVGMSLTRLLGTAYLGYAATVWFARDVRDVTAQRAIALGNFVSWTLGLVVSVVGIVTGLAGPQGWLLIGLEVTFAVGWGYFTVAERSEVATT